MNPFFGLITSMGARSIRAAYLLATILAVACIFASTVLQAQTFPDRPVQLVVPYVPAGLTDNIARYFAAQLKDIWKQPVVVENKAGASATLGAQAVAKANPDGYTLLLGSVGMATNPLMFKTLPYQASDLKPLVLVAMAPNVLFVHPSVPVKTVQELVEYARKNPGALKFASTGFGSSPHLAAELFAQSAGIKMLHVPYKGTGAAIADTLGGQVNVYFDTMQSMKYAQDGKLVALAVTTEKRLPDAPNLPTVEESGVAKGVISSSWFGYFAPSAVPPERSQQIAEALLQVAKDPKTQETLRGFGLIPVAVGPEGYQTFMKAETERWGAVIKAQNITVE